MDAIDAFYEFAERLMNIKRNQDATDAGTVDALLQEGILERLRPQLQLQLQNIQIGKPQVVQVTLFDRYEPVRFKLIEAATVGQLKEAVATHYKIPMKEFTLSLERFDVKTGMPAVRTKENLKDDLQVIKLFGGSRTPANTIFVIQPADKAIWMFDADGRTTLPVEVVQKGQTKTAVLKITAETPVSDLTKLINNVGIEGKVQKASIGKAKLTKADLHQYVYIWDLWRAQHFGKVVLYT